jgi:NO-binding membrane sensor protein with MHYT domain
VLPVHNFTYGLLTPGLGYVMSCLGAFIGLRCTTRARAFEGAARARWLLLGGTSIGTTGIWVMHFVAMLGFTIPDESIAYDVPVTILSLLVAVAIVCAGLLIVGFGRRLYRSLLLGGLITGLGVGCMHYLGMAAMRMPGKVTYDPFLFILSAVIAVVAATAALWAALRLRGVWTTLAASLIMGVAVSGMHYTGMAAMRVYRASGPGGMVMGGGGGASAESFLLPLIIGISVVSFMMSAAVASAPTEDEIRYDAALVAYTRSRFAAPQAVRPPVQRRWSTYRDVDRATADGALVYGAPAYGAPTYDALGNGAVPSGPASDGATSHGATSHGATSHGAANHGATSHGADATPPTPWALGEFRRPPEPR